MPSWVVCKQMYEILPRNMEAVRVVMKNQLLSSGPIGGAVMLWWVSNKKRCQGRSDSDHVPCLLCNYSSYG